MQNPFMSTAFKPDLAFTGAAERFFELLKSFSLPGAGAAGAAPDWSALAGSLAGQFEQWLKSSQSAGPWFTAASAPGSGAGFGAAASSFGPLPLGAGAAPQQDAQRSWDLVARLAQLQARRSRPPQPDRATAGRGAGKRPASAPARDRRSRRARKPRA